MRLSYNSCLEKGAKLIVSAALMMPLLACYPKDIHAFPQTPRISEIRKEPIKPAKTGSQDKSYVSGKVGCSTIGRSFEYKFSDGTRKTIDRMLEPEESVKDLICNDSNAFILTDSSLIMVPGEEVSNPSSGISLNLSFVRTDMKSTYKQGLIAWAASEDRCFFLTKDSGIKEMPVEGDTLIHSIPYDLKNAGMIFHSGFLFIAPAETEGKRHLVVMKFTDKARFRGIGLESESGPFTVRDGKLFLGKNEIIISGSKLADVGLGKK